MGYHRYKKKRQRRNSIFFEKKKRIVDRDVYVIRLEGQKAAATAAGEPDFQIEYRL